MEDCPSFLLFFFLTPFFLHEDTEMTISYMNDLRHLYRSPMSQPYLSFFGSYALVRSAFVSPLLFPTFDFSFFRFVTSLEH